MDKQEFIKVCEQVKPGSGEKLKRIISTGEADYLAEAFECKDAVDVLPGLFSWKKTEEGGKYWVDLYKQLPR